MDLAGSERIAKTSATKDRLKEATKINLSISTLCHVISASIDLKATYVTYKIQNLLVYLKIGFIGCKTKTLINFNLGPVNYNFDETMNTLRY